MTARRTEKRLQDAPISLAVFNQKQISDLTNQVSALAISNPCNSTGYQSILYNAGRMWSLRFPYKIYN